MKAEWFERNFGFIFWGIFLIVGLSVGGALVHHSTPKKPVINTSQCTSMIDPCIALVGSNQQVIATFNNFRFCGQNCVLYQDVHNKWVQFKGVYTMKWIGPEPGGKV